MTEESNVADQNTVAERQNDSFGILRKAICALTGEYKWKSDDRGVYLGNMPVLATVNNPLSEKILAQIAAFCSYAHRLYIDVWPRRLPKIFLTIDKEDVHNTSNSETIMTIDVKRPDDEKIMRFHITLVAPQDGMDIRCIVTSPRKNTSVSKEVKGAWIEVSK